MPELGGRRGVAKAGTWLGEVAPAAVVGGRALRGSTVAAHRGWGFALRWSLNALLGIAFAVHEFRRAHAGDDQD